MHFQRTYFSEVILNNPTIQPILIHFTYFFLLTQEYCSTIIFPLVKKNSFMVCTSKKDLIVFLVKKLNGM